MLQEFQRIGRLLFQEGLIDSHGGNMSLRRGDKIFITKSGAMLGELKEDDIVEVGLEAGENDRLASKELPTHRAVYKQGKCEAIVHAHPARAIALSITDNKIVPQDASGSYIYKAAPILRVRDGIGSEETARLAPNFLSQDNNVIVVVKGHGSFAIGKNLEEAYKYTSALENSCKVIIAVRSSGGRGGGGQGGRGPGGGQARGMGRERKEFKSAIPPGIGVMDRSRYRKR